MQLGVSSYAFGWRIGVRGYPAPPPYAERELLDFARAHALRVVQYGDHVPLHSFSPDRLERLRTEAGSGADRIELEIGGRGLTRTHLARCIQLARVLESPLLRFVIDGPDYEPSTAEVTELLREVVPVLENENLILGIENHDRFPARTLSAIMDDVGSRYVGICLDTANSLGAGEGLEHILEHLGRHTVNLHIKDFAIKRLPHAMGFHIEGRPAGAGMLDVASLRDRLEPHGRCRSAVLETWTPPEISFADTLAKEQRWAEQSLAHLKPLFPSR